MTHGLRDLVAAELARPVEPRARAMAAAIAAQYAGAARAVLFYGSCLREKQLDGLMLDFYVIVSSYRAAFGLGWRAVWNRLLPPNVFPFSHDRLLAKYAVMSEADFHRLNGPEAGDVSVWARFAQPARLVWAMDEAARDKAVDAVARAAPTLLGYARPMAAKGAKPLDLFRRGFELTYASELRAERKGRSGSIVDDDLERYRRFGEAALPLAHRPDKAAKSWRWFRRKGKALTLARLAKATTTYSGGVDYIAWKINRHAGTAIEVRPWMRRFPIVGALVMLPRLWRRGAIR
ncbi:hypothetical protein [Sphingosinicella sp.]|uniref:hypothetical protein n=1 Tax=Sphingosinicella sp. TaxID=1917971 RepID=UPI0040381877